MARGYKTAARTSGTPNRKTQAIIDRLDALGCDPIEGMAKITMDVIIEIGIRAQMYKELAQYVAPKRKTVEMQTDSRQSYVDARKAVKAKEKRETRRLNW
jgi:hypothetical protein